MAHPRQSPHSIQHLHPGDEVRVASREDILATLDDNGELDGMPLMPEMLELCDTKQRVYRRADKTCDTIHGTGGLRLHHTVHLERSRCSGAYHGGCQSGCLIFWKEAWLRPTQDGEAPRTDGDDARTSGESAGKLDTVMRRTRANREGDSDARYRCQATRLVEASEPLQWWDLRQYWRDWRDNGVTLGELMRGAGFFLFKQSLRLGGYRLQVSLYNRVQKWRGGVPFPFVTGSCTKTPVEPLDLQPGEYVRIKLHAEIVATLDRRNRNRGLFFDAEMVKHCGGIFRVQQRVTRIIDERSGEMLQFGTPGIILENVFCTSEVSGKRLFCPRSIHHYWREIWLERLEPSAAATPD